VLIQSSQRKRYFKVSVLLGLLFTAGAGIIWTFMHWADVCEVLHHPEQIPGWLFFLGVCLLPAAGCPTTLLYGGAALAYTHEKALIVVLAGIAANMAIVYFLTHTFLRKWVETLLKRKHLTIPEINLKNAWKTAFTIRSMLFIPFSIQNYTLSLTKLSFLPYFIAGMLIQGAYAASIVLFTDNFIEHMPYKKEAFLLGGGAVLVYICTKKLIKRKRLKHIASVSQK
jgi:uncharacterized membrane protein YdjX (TVP38/TMEM64 family)